MKQINAYIIEKLHLNKDIEITQSDYNKISFDIIYNLGWNTNPYTHDNKEYSWYSGVRKFVNEVIPDSIIGYIKDEHDLRNFLRKDLIEKQDRWVKIKDFYTISNTVDGIDFDKLINKVKRNGELLWKGTEKLYMYKQYLVLCDHESNKYPPIIIKAEQ